MKNLPTIAFWQFDLSYWFPKLHSNPMGSIQQDAEEILLQTGQSKKKKSVLRMEVGIFIGQFKSPLMLLLIGAVELSAFLGNTSDVFIILFIVLSTGLVNHSRFT